MNNEEFHDEITKFIEKGKREKKNAVMHVVSGNYLYEKIPMSLLQEDNVQGVIDYIEDHLWEPLEYCNAENIYDCILDGAEELLSAFRMTERKE